MRRTCDILNCFITKLDTDKKTFSKRKIDSLSLPSTLILRNLLHRERHLKEASDKNGEFMMDTLFKVRHSDVSALEYEIKKQK